MRDVEHLFRLTVSSAAQSTTAVPVGCMACRAGAAQRSGTPTLEAEAGTGQKSRHHRMDSNAGCADDGQRMLQLAVICIESI